MRKLSDVLVNDYGLDLTGWTSLVQAYSISSDGTAIVGFGFHNGNEEAFLAVIPEPATLALLVIGGLVVLRRHRRGA